MGISPMSKQFGDSSGFMDFLDYTIFLGLCSAEVKRLFFRKIVFFDELLDMAVVDTGLGAGCLQVC